MTCRECGAPAEIEEEDCMSGVDFDGREAVFRILLICCAAGHRYHMVDEEGTVKL